MPHPLARIKWLNIYTFSKAWAKNPGEADAMSQLLKELCNEGTVRCRGHDRPTHAHREDVIERLRENEMELRILDPQSKGDLHPIEDPERADYIAEAHAVFAVWRDLQPQTLTSNRKSPKQQILAFLADRFPHLKHQHERIAQLMNPGRSGGAPSSEK